MIIEEWWNKVRPNKEKPFGTEVLPEFERKSRTTSPNCGGWNSLQQWKNACKERSGFIGFNCDYDSLHKAKFLLPTSYGIRSYQLVWLEPE